MKFNKKKVFVVAIALCLVAILSMGTLAWFSDTGSVDNKFLFATTDDDTADEVFNVELTEPNAPTDKSYKDILPGDILAKDPTITNAGYYDQYIRVTVTIKNAAMFIEHIANKVSTFRSDVFVGFDNTKWIADTEKGGYEGKYDTATDTQTYVFYYNGILAGEQTTDANKVSWDVLFTAVKIPDDLTREDAAEINAAVNDATSLDTSFGISIVADAVQTKNVGAVDTNTHAANAKIAFTTVGM